jgi:V/A-type H+/Na+-transporting ATPase subunit K
VKPQAKYALGLTVVTAILAALATLLVLGPVGALAQPAGAAPRLGAEAAGWGLFSAGLATGLSSLAAGLAVARVGAAAIGALAEKPELFGRLLIFIGLAEGIAIYGLIVSILILNRLT